MQPHTITAFQRLVEIIATSRVEHVIHEHAPSRTVDDMARSPLLEMERIVKTVAFRTRGGAIVLAALRGTRRVDYPQLAALLGVNRRDLAPLSSEEVGSLTGMEPGSVSPIPLDEDSIVFIDDDIMTIHPSIFCGIGRPDRTLEIAPVDLLRITRGRLGRFSK